MNFRSIKAQTVFGLCSLGLAILMLSHAPAFAQSNPFQNGWSVETSKSSLEFESLKNETIKETSSFAEVYGEIRENGQARLTVALDSVDTNVDLRNVRMRFLFFETFNFPTAQINMDLTAGTLTGLSLDNPIQRRLPVRVQLREITQTYDANLKITLSSPSEVQIETIDPISINVSDFGLFEGLGKLEKAANVRIRPSTDISVNLTFKRNGSDNEAEALTLAAAESETPVATRNAALEPVGNFDQEACIGRFEILSRTGNIYFQSGSAQLTPASDALLEEVHDIVTRCPDLNVIIVGHTDSVGSEATNQLLSEARAQSVARFLRNKGEVADRIRTVGYGETRPIATNETSAGRQSNRRIEFAVAL